MPGVPCGYFLRIQVYRTRTSSSTGGRRKPQPNHAPASLAEGLGAHPHPGRGARWRLSSKLGNANAFVEEFEFDLETQTELHMFLCEYRVIRACSALQVSLLPSGASPDCFGGSYKGELQVTSSDPAGATIIKDDFFGTNRGATMQAADSYSSRCQGYSTYYNTDYYHANTGPACVSHSLDKTVTAAALFQGQSTKLQSPVIDQSALPGCASENGELSKAKNKIPVAHCNSIFCAWPRKIHIQSAWTYE